MKRLIIALIAVSLLFIANCGRPGQNDSKKDDKKDSGTKTESVEKGKKGDKDSKDKDSDKDKKGTDAVPVQIVKPTRGDISSFLLFSSNIDAEKIVDIYPMSSGIIRKILRDEGDKVRKDDALAILDDREAVINEKRAHINYKKLTNEFERKKLIFEKQMISKEEFDSLKHQMDTAKLDWEQNKLLLSYTRITTPISGVVTKRFFKEGNKVSTSQLAFSVVQNKEKIAVVNIPEQEKDNLFLKQKTVIICGKKEVPGFVKRISPAIDPDSGTFKVTVHVNDKEDGLSVGQFANIKIIKKVHKNVMILSKDALIYEGGKVYIFVLDKENKAFKKEIPLGFEEGDRVEVTDVLKDSDRVVTAGKSSLKNETLVKVVEQTEL